ncbi:MAG TPA: NnrS family protein [Methylomirabilota bacterium]|jgi:hypothetical protein|nr:NnrS family protein [Methylomirabilota bacterium]
MTGGPPLDPPVYRPFARLAFASVLLLGAPLGIWMAARSASAQALWLHAAVQIFGFFGTLIVGVAHHLLPRFTGRPVRGTALTPWLFDALVVAILLRVVGFETPTAAVAGAALHALAFATFAAWVWRALDPPPLRLLRVHLTLSGAWLAAAAALEAGLRARGGGAPDSAGMQAVYAMALVGGVLGWVLGVLLRAGPMFVRDWRVPVALARATPAALAVSVGLGVAAAFAGARAASWARAADVVAFATLAAAVVAAGALRRSRGALPMLSRTVPESRILRIAVASVLAGLALSLWALALGAEAPRALTDAARHLLAIGVVGSVVVAMSFRLIPVLDGRPLPWPALRAVASWALTGAVVLRTAQVIAPLGWLAVSPLVAASGALAWLAFACAGISLVVDQGRR